MATYASWGDVEAGSDHQFSEEEIRRVETLLDRAEQLLSVRVDLDYLLAEGLTTEERITTVLCNMVDRVLADPGHIRSETVGPISTTYQATGQPGTFVLTADDWALLGVPAYAGMGGTVALVDPALPIAVAPRSDTQERGGHLLVDQIVPELSN